MELWAGVGILLAVVALVAPVTPGFQNPWVVAGLWLAVLIYTVALVSTNWSKVAGTIATYPKSATFVLGAYAFLAVAGLVHTYVVPTAKAASREPASQEFKASLSSVRYREVGDTLILMVLVSVENNSGRPTLFSGWRLAVPEITTDKYSVFHPAMSVVLSDRMVPPQHMMAERSKNATQDGAMLRGWLMFELEGVTKARFDSVKATMVITYEARGSSHPIRWTNDLKNDGDSYHYYPMPD